jgi:F-type H+-transporting ATPase subunit b
MELNWSTFALEIINFLVLVWILKRFLYKPVLEVIARRRAGIEKTLAEARALHEDAGKLQAQYEGRITAWEQERQRARNALASELENERARRMAELQNALDQVQQQTRIAEARRRKDTLQHLEETALAQGARFATRLLEQAAGTDVETRLVDLVIGDLGRLPAERAEALREHAGRLPEAILVSSAFPVDAERKQRLAQALAGIAGTQIPLRFEQDGELLAGVRITFGAWVLGANLREELQGFTELALNE